MLPSMYIGLVLLMTLDTGGGGAVGGSVEAGKDFTGRDRIFNYYNDDPQKFSRRDNLTLEERVRDMENTVYGNERFGESGIVKRQRKNLHWLQVNTVVEIVIFVMMLMLILKLW